MGLLVDSIKAQKWTFAKTYAATAPHEYFVRTPETEELYQALVAKIKASGVNEKFYKATFRYLYIGQYKYWAYPNLINRVKIKGYTEKEKQELLNA